jgi:Alanine-zipper, major outer membrane lipoprotein
MRSTKMMLAALLPVLALGACTTLSDQDRALLTAASQNAEAAKQQAAQANATAQQALQAAQAAQGDAKAANEKADRMFQRSLRK